MKKQRLLELAGVQIDEAGGAAFVVAVDDEGFTNALVGPFTNGGVALAWVREMTKKGYHFDNPQEPLDVQVPISPDQYVKNFE